MKQQRFEELHQDSWQKLNSLLVSKQSKTPKDLLDLKGRYQFIQLYRMVCQHYAIAKQRNYSPQLIRKLNALVLQGHHDLYKRKGHVLSSVYEFYRYTFPNRFREFIGLFWISLLFFLAPLVVMGLLCYFDADMLHSIMGYEQVAGMEESYNPDNEHFGRNSERQADDDVLMFGFYIMNNVGIDFRIYAMGLFAGVGTLFSMVFNGLVIGGVAGHITGIGYGQTFWQFVVGHGSFELTAAVISGAAGLRLAQALFMPGNYSRSDAFKIAGIQSIHLLMGAATMTFIAAFIEAFWSSSSVIPFFIKYVVGFFLWVLVLSYLFLSGKRDVHET